MEFQTDDALSRKPERLPMASSQELQTPAFSRPAEGPAPHRGGGRFSWDPVRAQRRAPSPELPRAGPQAGWLCPATFPLLELWRPRPGRPEW